MKNRIVKEEMDLLARYREMERKAHEKMEKMTVEQRKRNLEDVLFEYSTRQLTKELLDELDALINQQDC